MPVTCDTGVSSVDAWLWSGQTMRLAGLDFVPMCHPAFQDTAQRVVKGQAAVYFLRQQPHGSVWLLKKFSPSRRPSDEYLARVQECLPGGIEFFTCTQRRFLSADLVDGRHSPYRAPEFAAWLEGTILMPKVPGTSWSVVADSLRSGEVDLTLAQRLRAAANLADCVGRLETAGCCHRDLSGSNVFLADDARIFVIDWDSLWQAQLPYQANTTVGTPGYIAPFTRSPTGDWDALRSWRPYADRYALAVLIAEILLVSTALSDAQEDSTLFAQAQLEHPDGEFIRTQTDRLMQISIAVGQLFNEAVHAPARLHRMWCGNVGDGCLVRSVTQPRHRIPLRCLPRGTSPTARSDVSGDRLRALPTTYADRPAEAGDAAIEGQPGTVCDLPGRAVDPLEAGAVGLGARPPHRQLHAMSQLLPAPKDQARVTGRTGPSTPL
jgi:serine/threonine protein kinase